MKRTAATPRFILVVIALFSAVLLLPWGNSGLAAAPPGGCPHCQGPAPGISSGHCCQPDLPGHCGASGKAGRFCCRCSAANPAFISLPAAATACWQVSPYLPPRVKVSAQLFPPNIFHPPEQNHFSLPV